MPPIMIGGVQKLRWQNFSLFLTTLVCRIDVQGEINVQVGKFLKNIKRAGQNRRAGGIFFLKINKRADQNKTVQGEIFSQNLFF